MSFSKTLLKSGENTLWAVTKHVAVLGAISCSLIEIITSTTSDISSLLFASFARAGQGWKNCHCGYGMIYLWKMEKLVSALATVWGPRNGYYHSPETLRDMTWSGSRRHKCCLFWTPMSQKCGQEIKMSTMKRAASFYNQLCHLYIVCNFVNFLLVLHHLGWFQPYMCIHL